MFFITLNILISFIGFAFALSQALPSGSQVLGVMIVLYSGANIYIRSKLIRGGSPNMRSQFRAYSMYMAVSLPLIYSNLIVVSMGGGMAFFVMFPTVLGSVVVSVINHHFILHYAKDPSS